MSTQVHGYPIRLNLVAQPTKDKMGIAHGQDHGL